jgi:hypothetical protein
VASPLAALVIVQVCVPSISASSTAVTVTCCGVAKLPVVKVSAPLTVQSASPVAVTMTSAAGAVVSETL